MTREKTNEFYKILEDYKNELEKNTIFPRALLQHENDKTFQRLIDRLAPIMTEIEDDTKDLLSSGV
jgi:hypothetical protein